jgi:hypothetical protein
MFFSISSLNLENIDTEEEISVHVQNVCLSEHSSSKHVTSAI